jgi:glyoxylase-like metal-dependent hydrolase (beta-lactamase superfamily II)
LVVAVSLAAAGQGAAAEDMFRVTLLGIGTPVPAPDRFGKSTLIEAGDQRIVVDFDRGVATRLGQLRVPPGSITAHFLTHFHSDHLNGLPDLWLTGCYGRLIASATRSSSFMVHPERQSWRGICRKPLQSTSRPARPMRVIPLLASASLLTT